MHRIAWSYLLVPLLLVLGACSSTTPPAPVAAEPAEVAPLIIGAELLTADDTGPLIASIQQRGYDMAPYCAHQNQWDPDTPREFIGTPEHIDLLNTTLELAPPEVKPATKRLLDNVINVLAPFDPDGNPDAKDPVMVENAPTDLLATAAVLEDIESFFCDRENAPPGMGSGTSSGFTRSDL